MLLESRLIKKFQPPYNISSKDDKSPYYIHLTTDKFPRPLINHQSLKAVAGPFLNGYVPRKILRSFRHTAPYCTTPHPLRPCLYSHLGLCHPCPGDPQTKVKDYLLNISRLKRLLRGQFKQVMRQAIKDLDFETASALRDLLHQPISPDEYLVNPNLTADRRQESLTALQSVLGYWPLTRIECFDISNLSGVSATAAMTVAIDGEISPRHYRHFTIRSQNTPNDVAMLAEVLSRRLKRADWPIPDLIVLDGGKSQLSIVNWTIPTIALAKREEIIHTVDNKDIKLPKDHPGLQLLQQLRDEAHRFSRRLHHMHRRIIIK